MCKLGFGQLQGKKKKKEKKGMEEGKRHKAARICKNQQCLHIIPSLPTPLFLPTSPQPLLPPQLSGTHTLTCRQVLAYNCVQATQPGTRCCRQTLCQDALPGMRSSGLTTLSKLLCRVYLLWAHSLSKLLCWECKASGNFASNSCNISQLLILVRGAPAAKSGMATRSSLGKG